jgi:hypothetical protein
MLRTLPGRGLPTLAAETRTVRLSGLGGGAADKRGNQYESWWTARRLLDLADGTCDLVRLEPPGDEGAGAELWAESGGVRCYDQAKDVPSRGGWTPRALATGPLALLLPHLAAGHHVKLVLSTPATRFAELLRVIATATHSGMLKALLTAEQRVAFDQVCAALGCDADTAISYLHRCTVADWSREALRDRVRLQAELMFAANPDTTIDLLSGFVDDHLHQTITAVDVLDFLAERGVRRNLLVGEPTTLEAFRSTGRRFASRLRTSNRPPPVARPELADLAALLADPSTPQIVVVDGGAGSGKSSLVADAMAHLDSDGWAVCGVRMDRVPPATLTSKALGAHLGLPASPGLIAAATSKTVPTVLVIDQLDAVSQFSGRLSEPFEAVTEILDELVVGPAAKVVLVVRTIDLDNDARLSALIRDTVRVKRFELGAFTDAQLAAGLGSLELAMSAVDAQMRDLLRVPLHFAVFSQLSPAARSRRFASLPDLYLSYTDEVHSQILERSPTFVWDATVSRIVRYVSDNETLAVPRLALAGASPGGVVQLESHGVVVGDDDHIGFFHETYFDYLFATNFVATGQRLLDFVVESGQQLFRRAQVRQILVHIAAVTPQHFIAEVRALLADDRIRSHIKDVVISVLGLIGASERSWLDIEDLVLGDGWIARHLSAAVAGPDWFDAIDAAGRWPVLLTDDETSANARDLLVECARSRPLRASELTEPYVGSTPEWRAAIAVLVERSFCADLAPFVVRLVAAGELDGVSSQFRGGFDFWSLLEEISGDHPVEAAELLGVFLRRALAVGSPDPFESGDLRTDSRGSEQVLEDLLAGAPGPFIDAVVPFVVAVAESTAVDDGDPLRVVRRWRYRHLGTQYAVDRALVHMVGLAFESLAATDVDRVGGIARTLAGTDIEVLRFLAARAYTAAAAAFADEALLWLASDTENLTLGWSGAPSWASRELIGAAAEHGSDAVLELVEGKLLNYWPRWEFSAEPGRRYVGATQEVLLAGIPVAHRSDQVSKRLAELDRKFDRQLLGPPDSGGIASFASPPIASTSAVHMSDDDWRRAIARWDDTRRSWDFPPRGGAHELASLLEAQAKFDPERFAALAATFDATVHVAYAEAVIRGAAPQLSAQGRGVLLTHLADVFGSGVGRAVCWVIEEKAADADAAAVDLLARYATDPDPVEDSPHDPDRTSGAFQLESAALNSTRGAVGRACAAILFAGDAFVTQISSILDGLVVDHTMAVRTAASGAVLAFSNHDKPAAQRHVEQILSHPDINIYDSRMIEDMLTWASMWDAARTVPLIERALAGPPHISRHGGFVWAVLSNRSELPAQLPAEVTMLPAGARVGAAQLMATWVDGDPGSVCTLLRDPDPLVAKEASAFLEHLDDLEPAVVDTVLACFAETAEFPEHLETVLHIFTRLPDTSAELALSMCERAIDLAGANASSEHVTRFAAARSILKIVTREYRRCPEDERDRCLDIIDRLCELRVYGIDEALSHTRSS